MAYFFISTGLRGAYMPDNGYVVKVNSRRELKAIVESEAQDIRDAGMVGANKREVQSTVADAWRNLKAKVRSPYAFVVPYGLHRTSGYRPYAIHIQHATRDDYLAQEDN